MPVKSYAGRDRNRDFALNKIRNLRSENDGARSTHPYPRIRGYLAPTSKRRARMNL
jgi:hypothetical protein